MSPFFEVLLLARLDLAEPLFEDFLEVRAEFRLLPLADVPMVGEVSF